MDRSRSSLTSLIVLTTVLNGSVIVAADAPVSAALPTMLSKWRNAVSKLNRFEVCGHRRIYNEAFDVETRSKFIIQCQTPHSLRIEFQQVAIPTGATSQRVNRKTHQPWALEAEEPSLWLWRETDGLLLRPGSGKVDPPSEATIRSFLVAHQPDRPAVDPLTVNDLGAYGPSHLFQEWCQSFVFSLWPRLLPKYTLPSIFAADEPGFARRFEWSLSTMKSGSIRLDGKPLLDEHRDVFQLLSVILDANTGRPLAQKMVDPTGNLETVYVFERWNENLESLSFDIDLRRYDGEHFALPVDLTLLPRRGVAKKQGRTR